MPDFARTALAGLILCLALGIPAVRAQGAAGSSWTDPPARTTEGARSGSAKPDVGTSAMDKPEIGKPGPGRLEARKSAPVAPQAAPPAVATPAAASRAATRPPRPQRTAVIRRERPRVAVAPSRPRVARAEPRRPRPPVRTAQVRPPRIAAAVPADARVHVRPYGYGPGYGSGYADDRLDRLNSAVSAGYLVMRRSTVEFPDGRTLRVYRPVEDDGPF